MSSSAFAAVAVVLSLLFFAGILICLEAGWRLGRRHSISQADDSVEGTKAIEAALLGLLGLLLAFTFSGAASRFDNRRLLVIQETNIIGTAYLRLDLLPPEPRNEIKKLMRYYLDLRIDLFRHLSNPAIRAEDTSAYQALQKQIWEKTVEAINKPGGPSGILILPILNEMFDITTTRSMWTLMHPPVIIFVLLAVLGMACAFVAGYSLIKSATRPWIHIVGFAFVLAFTFYVVLDLEFPRLGLIRIDYFDQAMVDLRSTMK